ncbi:MAG: extracellular solute-binding protein [Ruminococcus flavefaciens]|nr:extracellular solute-binding protein [Ruminococcus flavefaciens]
MIAAFEASHQNIKIEIAEEITGDWNEALSTAAAGGTLPDVALIAALPTAVSNGWALELSDLIAADSADWNMIPDSLRESGMYNGKSYGIPTSMHLAGMFVNLDLFEDLNVAPLSYGYTWDEFMSTVEALHNPSRGVAALKYVNDFVNFLPYLWDENQGWFTYDGTDVHLDSDEFVRAVKETNKLVSYSWAGLTEDQKNVTAGADKGDYDAWLQGATAMWYDASYCCEGYTNGSSITYEVEYIGLPGGKNVIIPDYCFIASTTEHPQEAWEFVKFMFWGVDSTTNRMAIDAADDHVSWTAMPITADSATLDRYFENFSVKGVREAYESMAQNGTVVEAFKFAPGYTQARWQGPTGITLDDNEATMSTIIDKCILGELSIDDYASQLNTLANGFISAERAAIDAITK